MDSYYKFTCLVLQSHKNILTKYKKQSVEIISTLRFYYLYFYVK